MAERQFGPYRLVHQIATGGMAEIYLARTRGFGGFEKYVALKMIHPNFSADDHFIQMLVDEAKITVQLQHVNIAQVFDLGRVGDSYYITMEYVDGCDLYKILRKASEQDRPMPIDIAVHIAREVANGLDYAHRKRDDAGKPLGIVHRDISPQNVLLSHAAEVKLVDFGIAKAAMRARQTAVGVIKGKYYYMSPEQAWGDPVDLRTDIFSAGILLYEMLTGQMLYLEEDLHLLLDMVRKADIAMPSTRRPEVPLELERIVMKALAKKPEQRWQTAHDFGTALEQFLHSRAPDFTTSRMSAFVAQVLADEPPNVPPPEPEPPHPARVTRGLDRESIISSRAELSDENSVIFRPDDLARQAGRRGETGRPTQPMQPPPGHPAAHKPQRLPDLATPHIPAKDFPDERTTISEPPTWQGGPDLDTPLSVDDLSGATVLENSETHDLLLHQEQIGEDSPTGGTSPLTDDGTTRIDIGVIGTGRESEADDTSETLPPLGSRAPALRDLVGETPGKSHPPAVSALRRPRESRKTPHQGIPYLRADSTHYPTLPVDDRTGRSERRDHISPAHLADDDEDDHPTISPHTGGPRMAPITGLGPHGGPSKSTKPVPVLPKAAPIGPPAKVGGSGKALPSPARASSMQTGTGAPRSGQGNTKGPPPVSGPPLAKPPRPPTSPPALPPMPAAKSPPSRPDSKIGVAHTEAAPAQTPGLNWVFDPEPARAFGSPPTAPAFQSMPAPPPPAPPLPSAPPVPAAPAWPEIINPGFSPPNGAPVLDLGGSLSPEIYSLAPSASKRWRGVLLALAFVVVALAVAAVVALVAAREEAPPAPTKLEVISIPPGADVTVDGKRVGVTPLPLDKVEAGKAYKITVELAKYERWERQEVVTQEGRTVKVIAALKPILGAMRVESTPPGAEVFLGQQSQSIGRTPVSRENMDPFVDVDVEVRLKGYRPDRQRLEWGGAREKTLSFKLVPSP